MRFICYVVHFLVCIWTSKQVISFETVSTDKCGTFESLHKENLIIQSFI